ncbi:DNA mismatch repair protein MutT [Candidatus Saccharibacteria bacterium]|nr:MAG: DNA mismatch repair protein MutT [Candidatus Saccharibacteria bacterium]
MNERETITQPYCAAFMLIERDGKYLFVRRSHTKWMDGYYGLPSGKVEKGEGFLRAAIREAKEEVDVIVQPQDAKYMLAFWLQSDDDPDNEWCNVIFRAEKWQGEPRNAEPHMHDAIAWFAPAELPENTIPSVRQMIETIENGESYGERHFEK